jgi:hypothetical protein
MAAASARLAVSAAAALVKALATSVATPLYSATDSARNRADDNFALRTVCVFEAVKAAAVPVAAAETLAEARLKQTKPNIAAIQKNSVVAGRI